MSRRSRAREVVLQILYEDDLNPSREMSLSDLFLCRRLGHEDALVEFGRMLLSGVRRNRRELDELLTKQTANWTLSRMATPIVVCTSTSVRFSV